MTWANPSPGADPMHRSGGAENVVDDQLAGLHRTRPALAEVTHDGPLPRPKEEAGEPAVRGSRLLVGPGKDEEQIRVTRMRDEGLVSPDFAIPRARARQWMRPIADRSLHVAR